MHPDQHGPFRCGHHNEPSDPALAYMPGAIEDANHPYVCRLCFPDLFPRPETAVAVAELLVQLDNAFDTVDAVRDRMRSLLGRQPGRPL